MLFRNAIRLLAENFKNVYKIALYKIIIALIATALCSAILLPQLIVVINSAPMQAFLSDVKDFFGAFVAKADETEKQLYLLTTTSSQHCELVFLVLRSINLVF